MTKKQQKPVKYICKKCGYEWIEIDPTIIKCWCSKCNLMMEKVKK